MALKLLIFTCLVFGNLLAQAASPSAPQTTENYHYLPFESSKTAIKKNISKKQKWVKKFAKKHGGYEALFYVLLAMAIDVVLAIIFILSLIFGWTVAAWITGIILAAQLVFLLGLWLFG